MQKRREVQVHAHLLHSGTIPAEGGVGSHCCCGSAGDPGSQESLKPPMCSGSSLVQASLSIQSYITARRTWPSKDVGPLPVRPKHWAPVCLSAAGCSVANYSGLVQDTVADLALRKFMSYFQFCEKYKGANLRGVTAIQNAYKSNYSRICSLK